MIKSLSPKEAKQLIEKKSSIKLIDVREPWEYNIAKIASSELVPLKELPKNLTKFDPNDVYIVYCHHGSRSFYACAYLIQQGFNKVYNLEGGINAWANQVDRTIKKY